MRIEIYLKSAHTHSIIKLSALSSMIFKRLLIFFSVVMVVACGGGDSDSGGSEDTNPPATSNKVLAIGDSITTGYNIATPWPTRLQTILGKEVVNFSKSGEMTRYGLNNIERLLNEHQPSHVFILMGTNDAIRGSISEAQSNLQSMIDIAKSKNATVVVGTLPVITNNASQNSRTGELSRSIRGLSGARIAEVRAAIGDGNGTIADGIHPNNQGQQLIAEAFATQF